MYTYIPPPEFYQGAPHLPSPPGAAGYTGPPYGAPAIPHSPPAPSVHSTPSPPKKRGRGRPRKNPLAPTSSAAAKASAKAAQVKSKAKSAKSKAVERIGKSKLDADEEKENEGIGAAPLGSDPVIISDSESDTEDGGRKQWTEAEKTKFFKWFLGDDEEGKANAQFEQHKKNPQRVYKRVRLLFAFFFGRNLLL